MSTLHQDLPFASGLPGKRPLYHKFVRELVGFHEFGRHTKVLSTWARDDQGETQVEAFVNEFWTSKQRAAHSLHEVSYRACFKPQLPRFFIQRLTRPGDTVYDPFQGRGTTLIEAALLGRVPAGCDINPLSNVFSRARLTPPSLHEVRQRLESIPFNRKISTPDELLVFYHPETLQQLCSLRHYFLKRPNLDHVDNWIRMVAVNRLTGHSAGFFSVYTLPPNQAVSIRSQQKINERRQQTPPLRDVPGLILKKSRQLMKDCDPKTLRALGKVAARALILTRDAAHTPELQSDSVGLIVTSPPFLDVVDYAGDNWLRCWFLGIDPASVRLSVPGKLEEWKTVMSSVFRELARVLRPGGHIAFEVGEIRGGTIRLEEHVIPCGASAGLKPRLVLINDQQFTKTANCWGVDNNAKGTNTNRVVLFQKPG